MTKRQSLNLTIIETERLVLRELTAADAPFIFELVNTADFHRFIGDKGVRDLEGAKTYISSGPQASYRSNGFGLYCTLIKASNTPIGICGLVKRDALKIPDIGFAFLPEFYGRGFGFESATGVLDHAHLAGIKQIAAITSPDNQRSITLLEKLGFVLVGLKQMSGDEALCKYFEIQKDQGR